MYHFLNGRNSYLTIRFKQTNNQTIKEGYMNRYMMIILLLLGMGFGASVAGPTASYFLTEAQADEGTLKNFTVQTNQGIVAFKVTKHFQRVYDSEGWYGRKIIKITPKADGTEFKAVIRAF